MPELSVLNITHYLIQALFLCSFIYLLLSIFVIRRLKSEKRQLIGNHPEIERPLTLLKPVCGLDTGLLDNFRSFCEQDYAQFQLLFAVHGESDPAIPLIEQLITEYPELDIELLIDPSLHGSNHKVSSLINLMPRVKHDYLVISDSDMRVEKNYLKLIMAGFENENTGAVTCLYAGQANGSIASRLNAMFINEWFLPSVLISRLIQKTEFCLGATMAIRRSILENAGGFESLKDHLADDYMLGKLVVDQGYNIHICAQPVTNMVDERDLGSLLSHELRWARTLRAVEPIAYTLTFTTDTLVMSVIAALSMALIGQHGWLAALIIIVTFLTRIIFHLSVESALDQDHTGQTRLLLLRDALSFLIRILSFTGNRVVWREQKFSVDHSGHIHTDGNQAESSTPELDKSRIISTLTTNQEYS